MVDKSGKADQPKVIGVEMDEATLQALAELVAPVTLWARAEGAPDPCLGDIVGLAVQVLHAQVFERAHGMIAGEVAPTVQ